MNQRFQYGVLVLFGLMMSATQASASIVLPTGFDNSPASKRGDITQCINDVAEVFPGPEDRDARLRAGNELFDARMAHSEAKYKFLMALNNTVAHFADQTNHGKNKVVESAAQETVKAVVSCSVANDSEYACHNVQCLTAPEQALADCYKWALTNPGFKRFYDEMMPDIAAGL